MTHQIFVGVAEDVIALGPVLAEIEFGAAENVHQAGQPRNHLLSVAQLSRIVEFGVVDHATKAVHLSDLGDYLVDLLTDVLGALELHHVGEVASLRHLDLRIRVAQGSV